jgi:hypothetical protein
MVHHRLPVLTVVHNNRGWHQSGCTQFMAGIRNRERRMGIGTSLTDPNIDYAMMAWATACAEDNQRSQRSRGRISAR